MVVGVLKQIQSLIVGKSVLVHLRSRFSEVVVDEACWKELSDGSEAEAAPAGTSKQFSSY